ncbi:MAG: cytidine deaminase [Bacteroidota bacterium]
MKKHHIQFEFTECSSTAELAAPDKRLLEAAIKARKNAYAPYSGFRVGAAVLLENGEIVIGNNQENASYPAGLCAERVAIFQAGAIYPNVAVLSVAISAAAEAHVVDRPAGPCGSCRQAMMEYEQKQNSPIRLLMQGEEGPIYICNAIADILPLAFGNSFLDNS